MKFCHARCIFLHLQLSIKESKIEKWKMTKFAFLLKSKAMKSLDFPSDFAYLVAIVKNYRYICIYTASSDMV